jgi:hypothetical protein
MQTTKNPGIEKLGSDGEWFLSTHADEDGRSSPTPFPIDLHARSQKQIILTLSAPASYSVRRPLLPSISRGNVEQTAPEAQTLARLSHYAILCVLLFCSFARGSSSFKAFNNVLRHFPSGHLRTNGSPLLVRNQSQQPQKSASGFCRT